MVFVKEVSDLTLDECIAGMHQQAINLQTFGAGYVISEMAGVSMSGRDRDLRLEDINRALKFHEFYYYAAMQRLHEGEVTCQTNPQTS